MQKHDHQRLTDPEMYTRWLQFGVFTPIFKTHSTQSANLERKIWAFPEHYQYMLEAIRLRYTLSPYIYTFAREAYDSGVSMCRPLYYFWPEADEAYSYNEEYLFGDRILATAVCEPIGADGRSARTIWFPRGSDWYDMALQRTYRGGSVKTLRYGIGENPWYVKAGSVIPLASKDLRNLQETSDVLGILVVPGAGKSTFSLYEDDGNSKDYDKSFARTLISKNRSGSRLTLSISPRQGSYDGMPLQREVYLVLEGEKNLPRKILCNGALAGEAHIEGGAVIINLPSVSADAMTDVEIIL